MTVRIQQLEGEQSQFDIRLEEERQSAAKGMELLLMAQENFARWSSPTARKARTAATDTRHSKRWERSWRRTATAPRRFTPRRLRLSQASLPRNSTT